MNTSQDRLLKEIAKAVLGKESQEEHRSFFPYQKHLKFIDLDGEALRIMVDAYGIEP